MQIGLGIGVNNQQRIQVAIMDALGGYILDNDGSLILEAA
jgi:hypothetical protein